jgi:nitroreductase
MNSPFLDLVRQRQSHRAYGSDPVDRDKIERCLEAARLAPSACNAQPWTFVVVDQPELKDKLADCTADSVIPLNHFTKQAPVHIVLVVEQPNISARFGAVVRNRPFPWIDMGIAAEHLCLQATEEGLGTCILGWFHEKKVKSLLSIPANRRVGLIITMGYPTQDPVRAKTRKPLDDIVRWNSYTAQHCK